MRVLTERLGREVQVVAYPFGGWTPEVAEIARDAGYRFACTVYDAPEADRQRIALPHVPRRAVGNIGGEAFAQGLAVRSGASLA